MRVIRETTVEGIRVSIFEWNNKYLLKFEDGMVEQTFKINISDTAEEADLEEFLKGDFYKKVKERFDEMNKSLQNGLKNL